MLFVVYKVGDVHVTPVLEVTMVPFNPTATNCDPVASTPQRLFVVFEAAGVHADPVLSDVMIVPPDPTATNFVPDQAMRSR